MKHMYLIESKGSEGWSPQFIVASHPKEIEHLVELCIQKGAEHIDIHNIRYRNLDIKEFNTLYDSGIEVYAKED